MRSGMIDRRLLITGRRKSVRIGRVIRTYFNGNFLFDDSKIRDNGLDTKCLVWSSGIRQDLLRIGRNLPIWPAGQTCDVIDGLPMHRIPFKVDSCIELVYFSMR
jgi:hypothetical protein